ncbi:MAG: DUF4097 family beta strand repeat-containing protein [Bacteroidota bacterium]
MNLIKPITLLLLLFLALGVQAQNANETISRKLDFKGNSTNKFLIVENIFGGISVESHNGTSVLLEVDKEISADNQSGLDKGKSEVGIKVAYVNGNIHIYPDTPFSEFDDKTGEFRYTERNRKRGYRYLLNYRIKVPQNIGLQLRAVNDGDISVQGVQAKELNIRNINGAISMENVTGKTNVNAINKDINISYSANPAEESYYKSINGDINLVLNEDLDADISFKSLNGDFYTNIEQVKSRPISNVKKTQGKKGTKYKWSSNSGFTLGDGGVKLHFDVLNGDVTIKR